MKLVVALAISAALLFSACESPLDQAKREASGPPAVQIEEPPVPLPMPGGGSNPYLPSTDPIEPPEDLLPGGYGFPPFGDCSDSLAC